MLRLLNCLSIYCLDINSAPFRSFLNFIFSTVESMLWLFLQHFSCIFNGSWTHKVDSRASPTIIIFLHSLGRLFKQFVLIKIKTLGQLEKTLKERIWRDWTFTQHVPNVLINVSTNCWQPSGAEAIKEQFIQLLNSRLQQWIEQERMTTHAERHIGNAFKLQFCILDDLFSRFFYFFAQMSSLIWTSD